MSGQQTTTTSCPAVAARCRAVIERYATRVRQRSVRENLDAALVAPIYWPRRTVLTLGIIFMTTGGIASLVTGDIGEAIRTAALFGGVTLAALLLAGDLRPTAADHRRRAHGNESTENSPQTTPTTTEED